MSKGATIAAGTRAEEVCADHLRAAGLRIRDRNWRCRLGEIDLIAEDGTTLVFVEVRMRRSMSHGGAAESVTAAKRSRLIAAAGLYLSRAGRERDCRFDVMLSDGREGGRIDWIRDAFGEG